MNYPNGKPYRKNSAIDGGKRPLPLVILSMVDVVCHLKKISNIQMRFILKATLQLFTKAYASTNS